jgi:two-component system cell cycle sensor histidine kinase/response regulator CckA
MSSWGAITTEDVLSAVLNGAPVRVAVIDKAGRFLLDPDPNPPRESDPGAPPGTTIFDLYGNSVPGMVEAIRATFAGASPQLTRELNGTRYFTSFLPRRSANGEIDAIFIVGTVLAEDEQNEQAVLTALQARERGVFNTSTVGLVYWDADGSLTDANDAFLDIVGYTRADVIAGNLSWLSLTPTEYHYLDARALEQIRATGRCDPFEKKYIHKDGHLIDVLLGAASWWPNASGGVAYVLDISERKRAEIEQEKLKAQLLQVQKLESLGLLAGGIAHDFNNILTPILGAASSALLTLPKDSSAYHDIELVMAGAQRAAALTRQMLAYSGKAQVEIHPLDLSEHVSEIAGLLQTTVSKKVELRLALAAGLPAVEADVAQLQQIVMNLVINGAEAIGEHDGTVQVATGKQWLDGTRKRGLLATDGVALGEYVYVEVRDTGHGMNAATVNKIFDPFYTTKFQGRGLGLAAVLGIVRTHRGAIEVESSEGEGSTFRVFFPVTGGSVVTEPKRIEAEGYRGAGLVLLIDDDDSVRHILRRMLTNMGFQVIDAADGDAGARLFDQRASEVVLVIVDMTMPKLNGEETLRAIRQTRPDVPVILISGYNELEATRHFSSKGLAGFLEKPFTATLLSQKVHAALAR